VIFSNHLHQRIQRPRDRSAAFAKRSQGNAEEAGEHHDRQHLVLRHRVEDRGGHQMRDEFLRIEVRVRQPGRCVRRRHRQVQPRAGIEHMHQRQAKRERNHARPQEPAERPHPDPTQSGRIAHVRDAAYQRGEHQRRDDHLD